MAVQYSLVPREMFRSLLGQARQPKSNEEYLIEKSEANIRNLTRKPKRTRIAADADRQKRLYTATRDLIRAKRKKAQQPVRVQITNLDQPVLGVTHGPIVEPPSILKHIPQRRRTLSARVGDDRYANLPAEVPIVAAPAPFAQPTPMRQRALLAAPIIATPALRVQNTESPASVNTALATSARRSPIVNQAMGYLGRLGTALNFGAQPDVPEPELPKRLSVNRAKVLKEKADDMALYIGDNRAYGNIVRQTDGKIFNEDRGSVIYGTDIGKVSEWLVGEAMNYTEKLTKPKGVERLRVITDTDKNVQNILDSAAQAVGVQRGTGRKRKTVTIIDAVPKKRGRPKTRYDDAPFRLERWRRRKI